MAASQCKMQMTKCPDSCFDFCIESDHLNGPLNMRHECDLRPGFLQDFCRFSPLIPSPLSVRHCIQAKHDLFVDGISATLN